VTLLFRVGSNISYQISHVRVGALAEKELRYITMTFLHGQM
jgi:hypothetical protein